MVLVGFKPDLWRPSGFLQCFDTVGLVARPVKIVPDMTYNVSSATLNPMHSLTHPLSDASHVSCLFAWFGDNRVGPRIVGGILSCGNDDVILCWLIRKTNLTCTRHTVWRRRLLSVVSTIFLVEITIHFCRYVCHWHSLIASSHHGHGQDKTVLSMSMVWTQSARQDKTVLSRLDPVSNLQLFSLKYTVDYWKVGNWKLSAVVFTPPTQTRPDNSSVLSVSVVWKSYCRRHFPEYCNIVISFIISNSRASQCVETCDSSPFTSSPPFRIIPSLVFSLPPFCLGAP